MSGFRGFPFGLNHPFEIDEAVDVLGSFMSAFRAKLSSSTILPPITKTSFGVRNATELGWSGAWDVVPFKFTENEDFTKHPHLGAWIESSEVGISAVLPNGATPYWRQVASADADAVTDVLREVNERVLPQRRSLGAGVWEPRLVIEILHRHFHGRRRSIDDGRLSFDLDILFEGGNPAVKTVPAWLSSLRAVIGQHKRANMQFELEVRYHHLSDGSVCRRPDFVDDAVGAAEALYPFIAFLMGGQA